MSISVSVGGKTILTADLDSDGPVFTEHLSLNGTFNHPFDPSTSEAALNPLLPLTQAAQESFRALDFADDSNLFLAHLRQYGHVRLPQAIAELSGTTEGHGTEVRDLLFSLSRDKQLASHVLATIVARIHEEVPNFFAVERSLGTFDWLLSGLTTELPFAISSQSSPDEKHSLHDSSDGNTVFNVSTNKAIVPAEALPNAANMVSSLCLSGGFGESLRLINRASAHYALTEASRVAMNRARRAVLYPSLNAALKGYCIGTFLYGATRMIECLNIGDTPSILGSCFSTGLALIGLLYSGSVAKALLIGSAASPAGYVQQARNFLEQKRNESLSVLGSTLLSHIDIHGAAHTALSLAPYSKHFWRDQFAKRSGLDPCVSRRYHNISITPDTFLTQEEHQELQNQLLQLGLNEALASVENIRAADANSNLLNALTMAHAFVQRSTPGTQISSHIGLMQLIRTANHEPCGSSGEREDLSRSFDILLKHFSLSKEDWAFAARPLWASYVIEKMVDHNKAQRIALRVLKSWL